jgi:hypothetical protein
MRVWTQTLPHWQIRSLASVPQGVMCCVCVLWVKQQDTHVCVEYQHFVRRHGSEECMWPLWGLVCAVLCCAVLCCGCCDILAAALAVAAM